jgi:hypothetical protein
MPVLRGHIAGVRFAIDQGIDYGRVEYRSVSALDYARQVGNPEVIELLGAQRKI